MRIQSGKTLAIGLFLTIVPDVSAQAEMPQITVGFVNRAEVDRKSLKQGLEFAAMILRRTGVELLTVDCSLEATRSVPPCSGFTGPGQISIRIIRRPQKATDEIGCRKLGFADELDTTPGNGIVYLFGDVIETVAKRSESSTTGCFRSGDHPRNRTPADCSGTFGRGYHA